MSYSSPVDPFGGATEDAREPDDPVSEPEGRPEDGPAVPDEATAQAPGQGAHGHPGTPSRAAGYPPPGSTHYPAPGTPVHPVPGPSVYPAPGAHGYGPSTQDSPTARRAGGGLALFLAILAFALCVVPALSLTARITAVVAVVLTIFGLTTSRGRTTHGMRIAAMIIAVVAIVGSIVVPRAWTSIKDFVDSLGSPGTSTSTGRPSSGGGSVGGDPGLVADPVPGADPEVEVQFGQFVAEVDDGDVDSELLATIRNPSTAPFEVKIVVQATGADGAAIDSDDAYSFPLLPGQWTDVSLFTDVALRDVEAMRGATFEVISTEFTDTEPQAEIDRVTTSDFAVTLGPLDRRLDVFDDIEVALPIHVVNNTGSTAEGMFTVQSVRPDGYVVRTDTFWSGDLLPGQSTSGEVFETSFEEKVAALEGVTFQIVDFWIIDR